MLLVGAALAGFIVLFPLRVVRGFYALELPRSGLAVTLLIAGIGVAALAGLWAISHRPGTGRCRAVASGRSPEP